MVEQLPEAFSIQEGPVRYNNGPSLIQLYSHDFDKIYKDYIFMYLNNTGFENNLLFS